MELAEVMRTTFACREFTDDPVQDEQLYRILDRARFAPSGGNRQGWGVIVVRERSTREELAKLIAPHMKRYIAQVQAGEAPWNTIHESRVDEETIERTPAPTALIERVVGAPVLLVVCVDLGVVASFDRHLDRVGVVSGASIYPFVWNILLAARDEGLGGTLTTYLTAAEPAAQALLGVPRHVAIAALVPLGHPVKQLTRLSRRPVEEFAMRERWGGETLGGAG